MGWTLVPIGDGSVSVAVEDHPDTGGVLTPSEQSRAVAADDSPALAATALPREPDAPEKVAPENLRRFPYADASDRDGVQGHAA